MSETKTEYNSGRYTTFGDRLDEFLSKTQINREDISMVEYKNDGLHLRMNNGDQIIYIKAGSYN